jgi:selenocysteine-specific elongation factor
VFVIGTAGHVDHGKSTLVHALTGINPDRLREEQERQMTLDLGFAWLRLPSGREVSIIDVPGHEDFIRNMLAGVGGIDLAMLVIAADEAVMPQTREHLAILDLLQIPQGIVVLSKSDLVTDPDWLELVIEDVRESLAHTIFARAPIIPVSALTGNGLEKLKTELDRQLDAAVPRRDIGRPRLPIDRAFSITGFGTVVTGTLLDGSLHVGDEVELVPGGLTSRIRNLQTHKTRVLEALPGSRVAANLLGLEPGQISRGQVLASPGWLTATNLVDARLKLLLSARQALQHNTEVEFFTGAAQSLCHIRLLDVKELAPGSEAWVQLRLQEPVALVRGDRFIVRSSSPNMTLGGGVIVQTKPAKRYRRFQPEILAQLEALQRGTPEDLLLQSLTRSGISEARHIIQLIGMPGEVVALSLEQLIQTGQIVALTSNGDLAGLAQSGTGFATIGQWHTVCDNLASILKDYEQRNPLSLGMPREELKNRLRLSAALFNQVIERARSAGLIEGDTSTIHSAGWSPTLSGDQQRAVDQVMRSFAAAGFTPPTSSDIEAQLGPGLLSYLVQSGKLVRVADNVLFSAATFAEMTQRVIAYLTDHETITVAEVRDLFGTSRKYALGLLEDLDSRRITKRLGDARVLRVRDARVTSALDG